METSLFVDATFAWSTTRGGTKGLDNGLFCIRGFFRCDDMLPGGEKTLPGKIKFGKIFCPKFQDYSIFPEF